MVKLIRFNYFEIRLESELDLQGEQYSAPWNMMSLINYLSVGRNELNTVVDLGEYRAELDRTTFINAVNPEVHSFQITKLREDSLPSIKVIGVPREELNLAENQYIGEFITIVFDPTYFTVGVQSNLYSLNLKQVETFLTEIRRRYMEHISTPDEIPLRVSLNPILDPSQVEVVRNSDIFRKITIKGSAVSAASLIENPTVHALSEVVGEMQGLQFNISISVGRVSKDQSLNQEAIRNIIDTFNQTGEETKPSVEITGRNDEESPLEHINLLTPRLTNQVKINDNGIRVIGHELIHNSFMEKYQEIRTSIARLNL